MNFSGVFLEKQAVEYDKDKEKELVRKIQSGAPDARHAYRKLRRDFQPMIDSLIRQAKNNNTNVPDAMLRSSVEVQFPDLIRSYDPNHESGAALGTHLYRRMKGIMKNTLDENFSSFHVPRNELDESRKLGQAIREAQLSFNTNNPTDDQILQFYPDRTKEDIAKYRKYVYTDLLSDKVMRQEEDGSAITLKDMYTGERVLQNPKDEMRAFEIDKLTKLLKEKMTPEEAAVIEEHFIKGHGLNRSALEHGMSTTRLRAILAKWERIRKENGYF